MIWIKSLYKNRNIYLLLMIALLLIMAVLDSFKLVPLLITVLLIVFYYLLIMRYHFLNYSFIFLIVVGILCLTSVFQTEFMQLLDQYRDNKLVELYLTNGGSNIAMIIILLLFIYSFLSAQKQKKHQEHTT